MLRLIENQFRQPKGIIGKLISLLMRTNHIKIYAKTINKLDIHDHEWARC